MSAEAPGPEMALSTDDGGAKPTAPPADEWRLPAGLRWRDGTTVTHSYHYPLSHPALRPACP